MKPYRIKHVPTGLYYRTGDNNLVDKNGKIYQTGNNILNYESGSTVRVELQRYHKTYKTYGNNLSMYQVPTYSGRLIFDIPKSEFIKEPVTQWEIIPEERLKSYLGTVVNGNIICDCGELNENILGYPYAYDSESGDVIYAYLCRKCKKVLFTRD